MSDEALRKIETLLAQSPSDSGTRVRWIMEKNKMSHLLHKHSITGQKAVFLVLAMIIAICSNSVIAKPLKIYILVGQSNMQG